MNNVALLGFGTVGRGVYEILADEDRSVGAGICVKKILVRDTRKKRDVALPDGILTDDFGDILTDNSIDAVVCVMGGAEPEYSYIKKALTHGKHVITANKEVVAGHMKELLDLAAESGVKFLFEASVGGGIPIIAALTDMLKLNRITRINGILNGTTNFILTGLSRGEKNFDEVLRDAQRLGFAEANPSADIDGYDIMRKIVILSSIAFRCEIAESDVHLRGIRNITKEDIEMAESFGYTVKFMAQGLCGGSGYSLSVTPVLIKKDSVISNVNMEYNVILVEGDIVGVQCFIGKGAGKNATANAVVSDLLKALHNEDTYGGLGFGNKLTSTGVEGIENEYYLRVRCADSITLNKVLNNTQRYFQRSKLAFSDEKLYMLTEKIKAVEMKKLFEQLQKISDDVFYARLENNLI